VNALEGKMEVMSQALAQVADLLRASATTLRVVRSATEGEWSEAEPDEPAPLGRLDLAGTRDRDDELVRASRLRQFQQPPRH
jgi:hypothetical protein